MERDRFDWIAHFKEQNGGLPPKPSDVDAWYLSKPESYFKEKSEIAIAWYKAFARSLLADEIGEEKKQAVKEYIGDKLKFLPQLWISLCCSAVFAILVGAIAMYVLVDFSPIAWVKQHFGSVR